MPPTQTDEGARAAVEIRAEQPEVGVLLLSQIVEARHALALFSERPAGFGYLLKDRVLEIDDFLEAVRRVGDGGTAIDPEVIAQLLGRRARRRTRSASSPRASGRCSTLMAEGRSNRGNRREARPQPEDRRDARAPDLRKLGLGPAPDDHRRVLAVLAFLRA